MKKNVIKRPSILILYTGGTFGMDIRIQPDKKSSSLSIPALSPQLLKKRLDEQVPELQQIARCTVKVLLNRDSSHIGFDEWRKFAFEIKKSWKNFDGIVLLHGTDTLAYSASALSFLLRPCLKPVVLTGAQRPLAAIRTDARTNLISAVEIAAHGPRPQVNQVTVFFGDYLFQGNRVRKKSVFDFDAFESPQAPVLAHVGTTIRYSHPTQKPRISRFQLQPLLNRKVLMLHVTPSFASETVRNLLPQLDGLVLVIFHSGTAPTHEETFLSLLKSAEELHIPIVLVTEGRTQSSSQGSQTQKVSYAASQGLQKPSCFWANSMTPECAFVKTALILGQIDTTDRLKKFDALWATDFADEG